MPPQRHRSPEALLSVAVLIGLGAYFAVLAYRYRDMFLLIEYRQYAFHAPQASLFNPRAFSHLFDLNSYPGDFQIAFSRSTSIWMAVLLGDVCGPSPICHNSLQTLMLVGAIVCIGLSVRALSISTSWFPAVAAGVVVALSVPVIDAITWQATIFDKTAMLFTTLTLLVASRLGMEDTRPLRLLVNNLLLFVTTFAAYNAKEAALLLAPATVLLLLTRGMIAGRTLVGATRRALLLAGLPLGYACLHVAMLYYDRAYLHPDELSRVTHGDIVFNLNLYSRYMLDLLGGTWTIADIEIVAAGLFLLVLTGFALDIGGHARRHIPIAAFPMLAFLASVAIAIRTSATSPFYLLVPMAYLGITLGLSIDTVLFRLHSGGRRLFFVALCSALLAGRAITLGDALPDYDHMESLSTNFQRTLAQVKAVVPDMPTGRILFVLPAGEIRGYMYASSPGDGGDHALAPYLASPDASLADLRGLEARIKDVPSAKAASTIQKGDLVAYLAQDMSLARLERVP